jgi:hypothetical protein
MLSELVKFQNPLNSTFKGAPESPPVTTDLRSGDTCMQ